MTSQLDFNFEPLYFIGFKILYLKKYGHLGIAIYDINISYSNFKKLIN